MKKAYRIILSIIIIITVAITSYIIGYKTSNNISQTFYAQIKEINDTIILVEGLSVNDINFRGNFSFSISNKTKLEWRNTKINLSNLNIGDNISITYAGDIQETEPAKINNILKIQLLEDEK